MTAVLVVEMGLQTFLTTTNIAKYGALFEVRNWRKSYKYLVEAIRSLLWSPKRGGSILAVSIVLIRAGTGPSSQ
jgi:hypothetical protein